MKTLTITRRGALTTIAASTLLFGLFSQGLSMTAKAAPVTLPPPAQDVAASQQLEKAIFAGGCFWGVQGVFQHVKGVSAAVSGYSGGTAADAYYRAVVTGKTKHAESVEVTYDPSQISYGELLRIFFSVAHDPTQLNRQGPDVGPQYRSAIFATSPEQMQVAQAYIAQLNAAKAFAKPIVTQLEAEASFYPAELYHQDYTFENPNQPYVRINNLPKLRNLQQLFPDNYRSEPVLYKATRNAAANAGAAS